MQRHPAPKQARDQLLLAQGLKGLRGHLLELQ